MGRPSVSWQQFVQVGAENGLDYLGPIRAYEEPKSRDTVRWRCRITGEEIRASYSSVRSGLAGNRYKDVVETQMPRYVELAQRLGLEFVYRPGKDYFPANNRSAALWRNRWGHEFEATYSELGYGHIPTRVMAEIERRP